MIITHDTDRLVEETRKYIKDDEINTILELGSRDGMQAVELANHYPNAVIYTFECNPTSIPLVEKNIKEYKNINIETYAVSDKTETIDFFPCSSNIGASSIYKPSGKYDKIEKYYLSDTIQVQAIRLDEFLTNNNIDAVDLVFADLQGAELKALMGLGKYIKTLKSLQAEVEFEEMYKDQPLFDEVNNFLNDSNFTMTWQAKYCKSFWGEGIYINNNYMK